MNFPKSYDSGLTVVGVKNPRWSDRENIRIDCELTILVVDTQTQEGHTETMPFTACPWDTFGSHCADIFEHLAQGHEGPVGEWQRPPVTVHDLQEELDKLLPDILLGLSTPEEIELARLLRIQIKETLNDPN